MHPPHTRRIAVSFRKVDSVNLSAIMTCKVDPSAPTVNCGRVHFGIVAGKPLQFAIECSVENPHGSSAHNEASAIRADRGSSHNFLKGVRYGLDYTAVGDAKDTVDGSR